MEFFSAVFNILVSIVGGMILTLVLQYYFLAKYMQRNPVVGPPKKPFLEKFRLPEDLQKHLFSKNDDEKIDQPSVAISFLLQFLFYELRHSNAIKRWFHRKLSLEFDELLTKTTTGKFFEEITIRDLNLGSQFPNIKNITVGAIKMSEKNSYIETLDLCSEIEYCGNFQLSVDAKMKFGKTAYLSITVKQVHGLVRLQFTRFPYTHWSLSFHEDPQIDLEVESQFQGRQLQSNITSLIINQIKRAIKRKHTLPSYKIRYKPFFYKTDFLLENEYPEIPISAGILEVTNIEITRLVFNESISSIYTTLTIDSFAWVSFRSKQVAEDIIFFVTIDLCVSKQKQQNLGVVFKSEAQKPPESKATKSNFQDVTAETIVANSPAQKAGLKRGDRILAVDGKSVQNVTQIAKLFKSLTATTFNIRVERKVSNYRIVNSSTAQYDPKEPLTTITKTESENNLTETEKFPEDIPEPKTTPHKPDGRFSRSGLDYRIPKMISSSNENISKLAHTIGNFTLRKRKTSIDKNSTDSSTKSSPNISSSNSPDRAKTHYKEELLKHDEKDENSSIETIPKDEGDNNKNAASEMGETKTFSLTEEKISFISAPVNFSPNIECNENYQFQLKKEYKYLNINVWGKKTDSTQTEDVLLGYLNIPLSLVLNECAESNIGRYINQYALLPPDMTTPYQEFATHSGYNPYLCHGDILLSCTYIPSECDVNESYEIIDESAKFDLLVENPKHDFIRTHFHRSTQCDFCTKKIWLKDAMQCRNCAMCCHKKCIEKCQVSTSCVSSNQDILMKDQNDGVYPHPTVTTTVSCEEENEEITSLDYHRQSFSALSNPIEIGNMKRVSSAHNLVVPDNNSEGNQQSISLPPSAQHTPKRKMSFITLNPFTECTSLLENLCNNDSESDANMTIILDHLVQCIHNDNIMEMAKDSSKNLFKNLPTEERTTKITSTMTKVRNVLDLQRNEYDDLAQKSNKNISETEKARIAFLIGQADSKIHALSILMLHFCSGLQSCETLE